MFINKLTRHANSSFISSFVAHQHSFKDYLKKSPTYFLRKTFLLTPSKLVEKHYKIRGTK